MILDRRENALQYLGLSSRMDMALHFVHDMKPEQLAAGSKIQLDGDKVFYSVSEVTLSQKPPRFEYHQQYIDIHIPVTGTEAIGLCSAATRPADTEFDASKDFGLFDGKAVNQVQVPAGWFCVCFPDDAHVPCTGEDGHAILKVIMKIQVR